MHSNARALQPSQASPAPPSPGLGFLDAQPPKAPPLPITTFRNPPGASPSSAAGQGSLDTRLGSACITEGLLQKPASTTTTTTSQLPRNPTVTFGSAYAQRIDGGFLRFQTSSTRHHHSYGSDTTRAFSPPLPACRSVFRSHLTSSTLRSAFRVSHVSYQTATRRSATYGREENRIASLRTGVALTPQSQNTHAGSCSPSQDI
ncbi:hypothetical protein TcWFU_010128 [Taenia crassiceps]|uniref:Uncharacterized protein n=1 Tax=Taenia crassiceps TaxID=6207 RepID=A0ABR4QJ15_9CEST